MHRKFVAANKWFSILGTCDPIHRHRPKIYPKTCHKIILWQKLRCHKMILRHTLSQFKKFVLGDRKYFEDVTHYHGNYDVRHGHCSHGFIYGCVYDTGTRAYFTRSFQCLPAPVPPFNQARSTSTILPSMWRRLGGNLLAALIACSAAHTHSSAALIACSAAHTHSSAALFYVLACTLYTSFVYTV